MTVGTSNIAFCNLGYEATKIRLGKASARKSRYGVALLRRVPMIELKDNWVALTTINAMVSLKILCTVSTRFGAMSDSLVARTFNVF